MKERLWIAVARVDVTAMERGAVRRAGARHTALALNLTSSAEVCTVRAHVFR